MWLLLFSLLMLVQNVGLPSPASVEGIVVHAETGEPVSGIEVSLGHVLRLVPGSGLLGAAGRARRPTFKPIEPVRTDANGKFSFKDVEPGAMGLTTASSRFVNVSAMFLGGNGGPQWMEFDLAPGENRRNLVVRLSEVAVITGTVLRASGRSGVATPVQVWRANFEYRDSERNFQLAYSAIADDRGLYRIPGVIPGRYYVTAGNVPVQSGAASDVEFAYYPGTNDAGRAKEIKVGGGTEFRADFVLAPFRGYRVRGRVLDSKTGRPPKDVTLTLQNATDHRIGTVRPRYNGAGGEFALDDIPSGTYVIRASAVTNGPTSRDGVLYADSATAMIVVSGSDVDDVELKLATPFALETRIVLQGLGPLPVAEGPRFTIDLARLHNGVVNRWLGNGSSESPANRTSGLFTIAPLDAGEYEFRFVRVPEGYHVASAKLDGVEYLGRPVPLTGPTADRLEVTLSPTGGRISGTVTAEGSRTVANVQVALVPNRRDQWHLYRHVFTDGDGRFAFTDTAPGDYKLFAWETPVRNRYVDPVLLKEFEEQGKPIHTDEGRAAVATVPLTSLR
jgi:5-hydroxyisourate hydrolase-like protein (transthyretin family)